MRQKAASDRGLLSFLALTIRAKAEKLELVRHRLEAALTRNFLFELATEAFVNLDNFRALRADQVVVMPIVAFPQQFESGDAVTQVKPLYDSHFLQQVHRAVNRGQVAISGGQRCMDLFDRERMRVFAQNP